MGQGPSVPCHLPRSPATDPFLGTGRASHRPGRRRLLWEQSHKNRGLDPERWALTSWGWTTTFDSRLPWSRRRCRSHAAWEPGGGLRALGGVCACGTAGGGHALQTMSLSPVGGAATPGVGSGLSSYALDTSYRATAPQPCLLRRASAFGPGEGQPGLSLGPGGGQLSPELLTRGRDARYPLFSEPLMRPLPPQLGRLAAFTEGAPGSCQHDGSPDPMHRHTSGLCSLPEGLSWLHPLSVPHRPEAFCPPGAGGSCHLGFWAAFDFLL